MTVMYQIPQYALVAIGELLTSIAGKYQSLYLFYVSSSL